jgi:hypothetical protein
VTLATSADATKQRYRVGIAVPSAGYSDTDVLYDPPPTGVTPGYSIAPNGSPYCYEAAVAPNPANSVAIGVTFVSPTSQSFNLNYEFRNLTRGGPWTTATSAIAVNGSGVGTISHRSSTQDPTPNRDIMLYRVYYQNSPGVKTRLGLISLGAAPIA